MLSDYKINGTSKVKIDELGVNLEAQKPTIRFQCFACSHVLFSNLDVNIHEPENMKAHTNQRKMSVGCAENGAKNDEGMQKNPSMKNILRKSLGSKSR